MRCTQGFAASAGVFLKGPICPSWAEILTIIQRVIFASLWLSLPQKLRERTTPRSGFESFPRYQAYDFVRQTTIFCDFIRLMIAPKPRATRAMSRAVFA